MSSIFCKTLFVIIFLFQIVSKTLGWYSPSKANQRLWRRYRGKERGWFLVHPWSGKPGQGKPKEIHRNRVDGTRIPNRGGILRRWRPCWSLRRSLVFVPISSSLPGYGGPLGRIKDCIKSTTTIEYTHTDQPKHYQVPREMQRYSFFAFSQFSQLLLMRPAII